MTPKPGATAPVVMGHAVPAGTNPSGQVRIALTGDRQAWQIMIMGRSSKPVVKAGGRRDSVAIAAAVRACLTDGHITIQTPLVICNHQGDVVSTFKVAVLDLGKVDLDSYFGR